MMTNFVFFSIIFFVPFASAFAETIKPENENLTTIESSPKRNERVLSLFSIVTFKNTGCRASSNLNGTCYTSSECTSKGGTATGNCASGFGVCCVFTLSTTGTVTQNCTYIQNPGYPSIYSSTSGVTYTVNKCSSDVCYLRLDFSSFTLLGPSVTTELQGGLCADRLVITSTSSGTTIPTICGQNTGQHMYIDVGAASATATLAFTIGTGTSTSRQWQIKVTQIPCASSSRPPNGCLQYHYATSGRIQTFNFADASGYHLQNQQYDICIRPEAGMCCVQYQVCANEPRAFSLSSSAGATKALLDNNCPNPTDAPTQSLDYVEIIGSSACSNTNVLRSRYCGAVLNTDNTATIDMIICDCTQPFRVGIYTNDQTDVAGGTAPTTVAQGRGTCLDYRQIPCGTTGPSA